MSDNPTKAQLIEEIQQLRNRAAFAEVKRGACLREIEGLKQELLDAKQDRTRLQCERDILAEEADCWKSRAIDAEGSLACWRAEAFDD